MSKNHPSRKITVWYALDTCFVAVVSSNVYPHSFQPHKVLRRGGALSLKISTFPTLE